MNVLNALIIVMQRNRTDPDYIVSHQVRRVVRGIRQGDTNGEGYTSWFGTISYKGQQRQVTSVTHGEEQVVRLPWVLNLIDDNKEESNG